MPILLNPNASFLQLQTFYVEEPVGSKEQQNASGLSIFHFIDSKDDLERWKTKGYTVETEVPKDPKISQSNYDANKIINVLNTKWTRLNWKEWNQVYSASMRHRRIGSNEDQIEIDAITYRDLKLKKCLKWWNLTDNTGKEVPVTEQSIDQLVPEVAQKLLLDFEKVTEPSAEDLKK